MESYLAYFDETGDDGIGNTSTDHFVLTSIYMPANRWQDNFEKLRQMRKDLKEQYGLHVSTEFHTKQFLTNKNPYRKLGVDTRGKARYFEAFYHDLGFSGYAVYQRDH